MRVYKYGVPNTIPTFLYLPHGATLLKFNYQDSPHGSGFKLWVLVDPFAPKDVREFRLVGTGTEISLPTASELRYVGTAEHSPTGVVLHLFEVIR